MKSNIPRLLLSMFLAIAILMVPYTVSAQSYSSEVLDEASEIYCIQMTDQQFRDIVEELWGADLAAEVARVDKDVDLNAQNPGATKFDLNPVEDTLSHWCGYYLENEEIEGLKAEFNASECTGYDAFDGTWIGIGGLDEEAGLLQTGVDMAVLETFVEALPGWPQYLFDVDDGDEIHASIGHSETYPDYFYVVILDATTYEGWGGYVEYDPERSACWIFETPLKDLTSQFHVGSFDTVYFEECNWWDDDFENTGYHDIDWDGAGGTLTKFTEHTLNDEWVYSSSLGGDGESFSIYD